MRHYFDPVGASQNIFDSEQNINALHVDGDGNLCFSLTDHVEADNWIGAFDINPSDLIKLDPSDPAGTANRLDALIPPERMMCDSKLELNLIRPLTVGRIRPPRCLM